MNKTRILQITQTEWETLKEQILQFLPKLGGAALALFLGFLFAFIVRYSIRRMLNLLENSFIAKNRMRFFNLPAIKRMSYWLSNFVFWMVVIFSVTVATELLGFKVMAEWFSGIRLYLPKLSAAVLIGFAGMFAGRVVRDVFSNPALASRVNYALVIGKLIEWAIICISLIIAVDQMGLEIQFLTTMILAVVTTSLFGAALAFGLGAKTVISNILNSYYIQQEFRVGQKIKIAEHQGQITKITPSAVTIENTDGHWIIPGQIFGEKEALILKDPT